MPNPKDKERLDLLLVNRGFFESRQRAQAEIMAGNVLVNETPVLKAGQSVLINSEIRLKNQFAYVGRGALKLIHALDTFSLSPEGLVAMDVGASTGGFTEVFLERGAAKVYAVDVGTNQLHWKIRSDERVVPMEKTDARKLTEIDMNPKPQIAAVDVSFISLTLILPAVIQSMADGWKVVVLIKPQFELRRELISKGGFVKPKHHENAVGRIREFCDENEISMGEVIPSPITGAKSGNTEFLSLLSPLRNGS